MLPSPQARSQSKAIATSIDAATNIVAWLLQQGQERERRPPHASSNKTRRGPPPATIARGALPGDRPTLEPKTGLKYTKREENRGLEKKEGTMRCALRRPLHNKVERVSEKEPPRLRKRRQRR